MVDLKNDLVKLTVTGPRAYQLYGHDYDDPKYIELVKKGIQFLIDSNVISVNIGMDTGIDLLFGLSVIKYNRMMKSDEDKVKMYCYIPGKNQTTLYTDAEKNIHRFILLHADEIINVSTEECDDKIIKQRNTEMILNSNTLLSFWDGSETQSNTKDNIDYAKKQKMTIYNINPLDLDKEKIINK